MSLLIASGSVLSWVINKDAGMIAAASFVAFASAAIIDALVYQLLKEKTYFLRVNGSNVISAAVDSLIFPWIAFGGIMIFITIGQFVAKVGGGLVWSVIFKRIRG